MEGEWVSWDVSLSFPRKLDSFIGKFTRVLTVLCMMYVCRHPCAYVCACVPIVFVFIMYFMHICVCVVVCV